MSNTPFQPWREFRPEESNKPHGWIQWKGTSVCMDFRCVCGESSHIDDEFCYHVRCWKCGRVYEMAAFVEAREMTSEEAAKVEPTATCQDMEADIKKAIQ